MDAESSASASHHLCVLVHGLWGNPNHLSYLAKSLREKFPQDTVHVLLPKSNSGNFTYDGIEVGGERVTKEIEEELQALEEKGMHVTKLSVVGYSLGGLVARYAIGLLYHKGWFDKLEPVNFTTFATPHLGVRTPLLGFGNHLWNVLGARTLSISGRQLFIIDNFRDTGKPLLTLMTDPESIFIRALASFKHRSLYSNITNDRSAVYYTTAISRTDPFVNLSAVKVNYIPGQSPVLVDIANPVSAKEETNTLPEFRPRFSVETGNILGRLRLTVFFVFALPLGVVLFLSNALIQSVRSRQRIRLHIDGRSGIGKSYHIPLMVGNVRRTAEDMFENMNNRHEQEYLPAGSEEMAQPDSPLLSPRPISSSLVEKSTLNGDLGLDPAEPSASQATDPPHLDFPTLALAPDQFAMIQSLDDVGWKKYPVHIHSANHSHAAIIVRTDRASFKEGKVVVQHWLDNFDI